jgi:hypothetical protein
LLPRQSALRAEMNAQIPALCLGLPRPLRSPAILAIQRHFACASLKNLASFFDKFHAPAWTILDWLDPRRETIDPATMRTAVGTQAMALFLHMFDDHLSDGDLPFGHLLLQLRTEAWMRFRAGIATVAAGVRGGDELAASLVDLYFEGVHGGEPPHDAGSFRARTCRELATGLIMPMLLARRSGQDEEAVRAAFEAFVVAWRMLDDLNDAEQDSATGTLTSLFFALPPGPQGRWQGAKGSSTAAASLAAELLGGGHLEAFLAAIHAELGEAIARARRAGLAGYGVELDALRAGLRALGPPEVQAGASARPRQSPPHHPRHEEAPDEILH